MIKRTLAIAIVLAAHTASADQRHVLVLRSEGSADASTRAKIDTQVLKLAKSLPAKVEAGDISFGDAAAAVGCTPTDAPCRDEVMSTMGVDELVATTATTSGTEVRVSVRRLARSSQPKEASTTIPSGQAPDAKMNTDIGPLFGLVPPPTPPAGDNSVGAALGASLGAKGAGSAAPPVTAEPATPSATPTPPTPDAAAPPPPPAPDAAHPAAPTRTAQADPNVTAAPDGQVMTSPEGHADNRRLEVMGIAGGGALFVVGLVMWAEASATQNDIDNAPTRSPADFKNLRDLENSGDTYATLGNIAAVGGIALAGVSGFFYWRDRHNNTQQARISPAVIDHGVGLTFTVGGAP